MATTSQYEAFISHGHFSWYCFLYGFHPRFLSSIPHGKITSIYASKDKDVVLVMTQVFFNVLVKLQI